MYFHFRSPKQALFEFLAKVMTAAKEKQKSWVSFCLTTFHKAQKTVISKDFQSNNNITYIFNAKVRRQINVMLQKQFPYTKFASKLFKEYFVRK